MKMKSEKKIIEYMEELKENISKNVKSRDWKNVISDGEWLEALKWVLEDENN